MKVTLSGPDDLGQWVLHNEHGHAYPLVTDHADHPKAAALFGWMVPAGITDDEKIIESALDWLMEHIGDEVEAPAEAVAYFRESEEDED